MLEKLKVIIIEDMPSDAELTLRELRRVLPDFESMVIETEPELRKILEKCTPQLILSDYNLPSFNGLEALRISREKCPFIPFIILTGSLNEDIAIECMKAGADDYVIKEHIKRLGSAVLNAIEKKKAEKGHSDALIALQKSEERFRLISTSAQDAIIMINEDGAINFWNPAAEKTFGYSGEEVIGQNLHKLLAPKPFFNSYMSAFNTFKHNGKGRFVGKVIELEGVHKNGQIIPIELSLAHMELQGKFGAVGIIRDITQRKKVEGELKKSEQQYRKFFEQDISGVYLSTADGRLLDCNPAFARMLGYKNKNEILALKSDSVYNSNKNRKKFLKQLARKKSIAGYETELIHKSGRIVSCVENAMGIFTDNNELLQVQGYSFDISERKEAEKLLKESEERFRTIFENTAIGLYQTTKDGQIIMANPALVRMLGYNSFEDLASRNLAKEGFEPTYSREEFIRQMEVAGYVTGLETSWVRQDGKVVYLRESAKAVCDTKGEIQYYEGTVEDISAHKKAQEQIKNLAKFPAENPSPVMRIDRKGIIQYQNDAAKIMLKNLGYLKGESLPPRLLKLIDQAVQHQIKKTDIATNGQDYSVVAVYLDEGDYVNIYGMDISERKLGERILAAEYNIAQAMVKANDIYTLFPIIENELKTVISHSDFKLVIVGEKGGLIEPVLDEQHPFSPAKTLYEQVLNNKRTVSFTGDQIDDLLHNNLIEPLKNVPLFWLGVPVFLESKIIAVLTTEKEKERTEYPKRIVEMLEMVAHWMGIYIGRKQTEAERERLIAAIEQAAETFLITDKQGIIRYVNPAFESTTGYSRYEVIGKKTSLLKSGEHNNEFYKKIWETILSGKVWQGQIINCRKDGTRFIEEATISPIFNNSGNIEHFVAVNHDITREQELEQQFRQAQKMESIGRLAGGVAHDFNNMLGVILGYAELALNKLKPSAPIYRELEEIQKAGKHAAELTKQLLAFARKQTIAPRILDLNIVVSNMLKLLRRVIGEDIELIWKPGANLWPIKLDSMQINQILANLCGNARDAITGQGAVILETHNVTLDSGELTHHSVSQSGKYILLIISDTGSGMDKNTLTQIFEPFFTTKEQGKGTGLGLATVYGIVKQNNGLVNVYSEPGQGTTFKIYLPIYEGDEKLSEDSGSSVIPEGKGEEILVVEDEVAILNMASVMLQSIGYKVYSANNGAEALEMVKSNSKPIKLMITDVVMPGMNGKELAEKIQKDFPEIKVLFMSGYTSDVIAHRGVLEEGVNFITKPFSLASLADKVHQVLR